MQSTGARPKESGRIVAFPKDEPITAARSRLCRYRDLCALPEPRWLVRDYFQEGAFGLLYGQPGVGKSFLALDLALSIATKPAWHGHPVRQGPTVYVVAEGGRGIVKRVEAWRNIHGGGDLDGAFFLREAVQLRDAGQRGLLIRDLEAERIRPSLIVLDTLAKCFVGGEENSSKETGEFIAGVQDLQDRTGNPAVLVIHHSGKGDRETERGSSALRGAADAVFLLKEVGPLLSMSCVKQKDSEGSPEIRFRLAAVPLGADAEGEEITSCVIAPSEGRERESGKILKAGQQAALDLLRQHPEGLDVQAWRQQIAAAGFAVAERTIYNWIEQVFEDKVERLEDGSHRYRIASAN